MQYTVFIVFLLILGASALPAAGRESELVSALGAPGAEEQAAAGVVNLSRAMALALDSNPALAESREMILARRNRISQAGKWENPELGLEVEEFGLSRSWVLGEGDVTLGVTQAIPLGSRLSSEVELEAAGVRVLEARRGLQVLELAAGVSRAFVRCQAARDRLALSLEARDLAQAQVLVVRSRVEAGDIPPADVFRSQADLSRADLNLARARTEVHQANSGLAALWRGRAGQVTGVEGALGVPEEQDLLPGGSFSGPLEQLLEAMQARARARTSLEKARRVPDLNAGLGLRGIQGFEETALVVSLSVPIPFFNNNEGLIEEAAGIERSLKYAELSRRNQWAAEVEEAWIRMSSARERFQKLEQELLPLARRSHDAVDAGFREGRLVTLDLMESSRRLIEVKEEVVNAAESYNLARIDLALLLGDLAGLEGRAADEN